MALSDLQLDVLAAVFDSFVPAVDRDDPEGFFRRRPSFQALLDLLASPGVGPTGGGPARSFLELDGGEREALLLAWKELVQLRAAFAALAEVAPGLSHGFSAEGFTNPSWTRIGYPGLRAAPPRIARSTRPLAVDGDTVLDCDVVVTGSGAGGGVVAGANPMPSIMATAHHTAQGIKARPR